MGGMDETKATEPRRSPRPRSRHRRSLPLATAVLAGAVLLAGCGEDELELDTGGAAGPVETGGASPDDGHGGHGSGHGMMLHETDATPADELTGADLATAEFVLLDTAPPGVDDVTGTAWLAQHQDGTTVTIRLTGLEPGVAYVSHLHEQPCGQDGGGDHFAFDPDGEPMPPNEVHLGFTASDEGAGEATVTNDLKVGDGARSVVVHPAESTDNKVACADF